MRAIIRYSMNNEKGNQIGNQLRAILEGAGFQRHGSANFEHPNIGPQDLEKTMSEFWKVASDPQSHGAPPEVELDHIWTYAGQRID